MGPLFALLALIATAAGVTGCGHASGSGSAAAAAAASPPPPAVQTAIARRATLQPAETLPGIVAPLQNVALSSSLAEPAVAVYVRDGDHVSRGQVLAVLSTRDLEANLESALRTAASDDAKTAQTQYQARYAITSGNDQVRSARAALQQAQATLANDARNLARDQQLFAQGYVSQQTVDQQRTTVNNDQQAVRSAQAALTTAQENVAVNGNADQGLQAANVAAARTQAAAERATADQIRAQIALATIRSPIDGYVVNRNINPGEYPAGRQIFTLQETDKVYAVLNGSTNQVFSLRPGAAASVRVTGVPNGAAFRGHLVAVLGQTTPGSTNFPVEVEVANPNGVLRSGMAVVGTVDLPKAMGIVVPRTAFLDDTHTSVMAVVDGHAQRVAVQEQAATPTESVVTGLAPGARVVTDGTLGLANGQQVAVR